MIHNQNIYTLVHIANWLSVQPCFWFICQKTAKFCDIPHYTVISIFMRGFQDSFGVFCIVENIGPYLYFIPLFPPPCLSWSKIPSGQTGSAHLWYCCGGLAVHVFMCLRLSVRVGTCGCACGICLKTAAQWQTLSWPPVWGSVSALCWRPDPEPLCWPTPQNTWRRWGTASHTHFTTTLHFPFWELGCLKG